MFAKLTWGQIAIALIGCLSAVCSFVVFFIFFCATLDPVPTTGSADCGGDFEPEFIVKEQIKSYLFDQVVPIETSIVIVFLASLMLIYGSLMRTSSFVFPYVCLSFAAVVATVPAAGCFIAGLAVIKIMTHEIMIFSASQLLCFMVFTVVYIHYQHIVHLKKPVPLVVNNDANSDVQSVQDNADTPDENWIPLTKRFEEKHDQWFY